MKSVYSTPRRQHRNLAVKLSQQLVLTSLLSGGLAIAAQAQTPLPPSILPTAPNSSSAAMPKISPLPLEATPRTYPGTNNSYIIGPGDRVQLAVYGYDEYNRSMLVMSDGTITLPVVGRVSVSGDTPEQLTNKLTQKLLTYLVEPVVTVNLISLRPITITVAGEVQRPGPLQLRGSTSTTAEGTNSTDMPTINVALLQAGGVTRNADIRRVVLKRAQPNGESKTTEIDLWKTLMSESGLSPETLRDGDTLYVPKLTADATINRRLMARSSLAPSTIRVRVVGEVKAPGQVKVPPDSTLSSAMAIAGGPTDKAKLKSVTLVRLDDSGQITKQTLDLRNLVDTVQVEEGDVIMVPKDGGRKFLDIAAPILSPLGFLFSIFR
ncbi:polysaccharide biosynthesis/export family protein [filamentous cyanobacterium LEGE 11480]|uniref:Polysaccharide biosynthesis/export family protein n=1 Tax=Romeriopsis navalis LEGE 11480 TaxID=2777977 RepID=A0A928Z351_9CYAN|nr:polysaccharide biosynthesis/export family protein [Romeriopsis navalis]MBE9028803.1 polysaccharide biosynthesis/export family protein [Romeriopsis navalis LEGE 11480]